MDREGRATSQRFPSLRHVLWTLETIWEHTIILIQTEDWICRQQEVVGCPGTPSQPPRTDKGNPLCRTARMPRSRLLTTLSGRIVPPVRRIAPEPTTETLGQVCVDLLGHPILPWSRKDIITRMQGSAQLNSKRVAPSLRSNQLRHFNKGQALCNSGGKAYMGILYPLAPFGRGPRGAVARNDVMLRPVPEPHALSHPCKWCLNAILASRSSGIRFRPRSVTCPPKKPRRAWRHFSLDAWVKRPLTVF